MVDDVLFDFFRFFIAFTSFFCCLFIWWHFIGEVARKLFKKNSDSLENIDEKSYNIKNEKE